MYKGDQSEDQNNEPWYDADGDCDCSDAGVEPSWEWNQEQGCYICSTCGRTC